jgi:hypothetical protein
VPRGDQPIRDRPTHLPDPDDADLHRNAACQM